MFAEAARKGLDLVGHRSDRVNVLLWRAQDRCGKKMMLSEEESVKPGRARTAEKTRCWSVTICDLRRRRRMHMISGHCQVIEHASLCDGRA